MKKKVLVRAPCLSQSGYGEQSRFALRALRSREDVFDVYLQPIPWGKTGWIWGESEFREWMDEKISKTQFLIQSKQLQPDISLQITIPNEFKKDAPINIGYTAGIETTMVSPQWLPKGNEMDKILVVSSHAKTSYQRTIADAKNQQTGEVVEYKLTTPIEVVHETTPRVDPEPIDELDLKTNFNFLFVSQFGPRKNFINAIRWWVEEFMDQDVGLVIKTNQISNSIIDFENTEMAIKGIVSSFPDRKCKIYLIHGDLSAGQMTWLYNHNKIKAIVNIAHGEGFGLPLFEAAREGLPIITVGWSGQLDFLHYDGRNYFQEVKYTLRPIQPEAVWPGVIEKETMWAFADEKSYKATLRKTKKKWKQAKKTAEELQTLLNTNFNEEKLFNGFCEAVYPGELPNFSEIDGISFCIPTNAKRPNELNLTINSIKKQIGLPHEIIVCGDIDNLDDEELVLVNQNDAAHSRKVALLRNAATVEAKYNVICYLDDDIILTKDWMANFIEFSKDKKWAVLSNRVLNPDGSRYWDRATIRPHRIVNYDHPEDDKTLYQPSCFFLIRREVFDKVKWDETKLVYADRQENQIPEDVQYSFDLIKEGYPLSFDENNLVWHNDDSYTVWNKGNAYRAHICLKKEIIQEKYGIDFFAPHKKEFKQAVMEAEENNDTF